MSLVRLFLLLCWGHTSVEAGLFMMNAKKVTPQDGATFEKDSATCIAPESLKEVQVNLDQAEQARQAAASRVEQLQEELARVQQDANRRVDVFQHMAEMSQNMTQTAVADKQSVEARLAEATQRLADSQSTLIDLQHAKLQAELDMKDKQAELGRLQTDWEHRHATLQQQIESLTSQLREATKAQGAAQSAEKAELVSVKASLDEERARYVQLEKETASVKAELTEMQTRKESLTSQYAQLQSEHDAALQASREEISKLEEAQTALASEKEEISKMYRDSLSSGNDSSDGGEVGAQFDKLLEVERRKVERLENEKIGLDTKLATMNDKFKKSKQALFDQEVEMQKMKQDYEVALKAEREKIMSLQSETQQMATDHENTLKLYQGALASNEELQANQVVLDLAKTECASKLEVALAGNEDTLEEEKAKVVALEAAKDTLLAEKVALQQSYDELESLKEKELLAAQSQCDSDLAAAAEEWREKLEEQRLLSEKGNAQVAALRVEHGESMERLRAQHQQSLDELRSSHEMALKELEATVDSLSAEVEDKEKRLKEIMGRSTREKEEVINKLANDHKKVVENILVESEKSSESLKKEHDRSLRDIQKRIEEAEETLSSTKSERDRLSELHHRLVAEVEHWESLFRQRPYLNVTHMQEDAVSFLQQAKQASIRKVDDCMSAVHTQLEAVHSKLEPAITQSREFYQNHLKEPIDLAVDTTVNVTRPVVAKIATELAPVKAAAQEQVELGRSAVTTATQNIFDDLVTEFQGACPKVVKTLKRMETRSFKIPKGVLKNIADSCKDSRGTVLMSLRATAILAAILLRRPLFRLAWWLIRSTLRLVWFLLPFRFFFGTKKKKVVLVKTSKGK